jgi:Flp pilus assembly protein TadD
MSGTTTDRDRGNAFYMKGRYAEAAECYRQALRHWPEDVDALNNLGAALADLGQFSEAIASYQKALALQPRHADAHYNLGNALRLLRRYDEAARCYAEALRLRPDMVGAHNNLGTVLWRLGRLAEAMTSLRRALELRPAYPMALINLGLTLADSGRIAEALVCYDEALRHDPENGDGHHNRALAWLLTGDWARGWPEYHWRWRCSEFSPPSFAQPSWDGGPLDGKTILLYTEQGFGDTLQFVRYARLVKERGATVILAAPPRLHAILRGVEGIDRLVSRDNFPEGFDVHAPLMSLPALFATTPNSIPGPVPYLRAESHRVARWSRELEPLDGLRVGIAWQGSPTMLPYDRWRSLPLALFEPLARIEGVRLISLQIGAGAEQIEAVAPRFPVVDLSGRLDETEGAFLDSAAVMANLDLFITCDSALAHLAGALGVPTWLALPAAPNWRWLLDRGDTPWYPSVRLFRQTVFGSWAEPFERMAEALRSLVMAKPRASTIAIEITPGELFDRLGILEIKERRVSDPEKRRHILEELASLAEARARVLDAEAIEASATALRGINESLWDAEDAIRACEARGDFGPEFIALARSIYRLNDERAALKRRINGQAGCTRQEIKHLPEY